MKTNSENNMGHKKYMLTSDYTLNHLRKNFNFKQMYLVSDKKYLNHGDHRVILCRKAASIAPDYYTFHGPIGYKSHQRFNSITIGPRFMISLVPINFANYFNNRKQIFPFFLFKKKTKKNSKMRDPVP